MRAFPGTAAALLLVAGVAFAADGAGPLAPPPVAPPDAAVPGKAEVVDCGGVPHYAFAGEAEDYFPGEGRETEAELFDEAVLDAKTRLYGILSGGDPSRRVELSGLFIARHWTEGPVHRVVCMVPVSAVRVTAGGPAESPPGKEVSATGNPGITIPPEIQIPETP